ncbi:MAG: undecaprenyl-phosphate glucose phosphotransferase [Hyphomicrobiaceae bacterium]
MSIPLVALDAPEAVQRVDDPGFGREAQASHVPVSSVGLPLSIAPRVLAAVEVATVLLCAVIAKVGYLDYFLKTGEPLQPYIIIALCMGAAVYLAFKQVGLYEPERLAGPEICVGKLLGSLILSLLSVLGFLYALKEVGSVSRGWVIVWTILTAFSIVCIRFEVARRVKRAMDSGFLLERIAIIGTNDFALSLASKIRQAEGLSRAIDLYHCRPPQSDDVRFVGDLKSLETAMARRPYDRVVVAIPSTNIDAIRATVRSLGAYTTNLLLCTDLAQMPVSTNGSRQLAGVRADVVHLVPLSEQSALVKRIVDVAVSASLLLVLWPLFLIVALAIKLDSPGPVFFRQRRLGQNGLPFGIYKFRSMTVTEDGPVIVQASRNDNRITRVGRIIRRTSIDELPQLLNVLLGQMSLVGPRPHAIAHDHEFAQKFDLFSRRRRVKPGITGWAQVNGFRGETTTSGDVRGRMEHDLYYIENWSIWFDIEIIARTLFVVARGAY